MHLSSDILISVRLVCRLSDLFSPLLFNMINVKTDCHFKCSFETCHNLFYFFKPLFPCSYFVYRIPKLLQVLMTLPSRCGTLDMVIYGFIFSYLLACLCSDYMLNLTHDAIIFIQVKQCQLLQTIKNLFEQWPSIPKSMCFDSS